MTQRSLEVRTAVTGTDFTQSPRTISTSIDWAVLDPLGVVRRDARFSGGPIGCPPELGHFGEVAVGHGGHEFVQGELGARTRRHPRLGGRTATGGECKGTHQQTFGHAILTLS